MALINTWVGYFDRSYEQAKTAILTRLGITNPELSDHTESNPLMIIVDIFLGISELLHYYIDNAAREVFLHSARQYKSAQKIAKLFNYRLKGYSASSVLLKFSIDNPEAGAVSIPVNTIVSAGDILYTTAETVQIPIGSTEVEVLAEQKQLGTEEYISDGNPEQYIDLPTNTVDKSVTVTVNSLQYTFVNDLYLSKDSDTHFTTEISQNRNMRILFGDGINGIIPALNSNIDVEYYTCEGEEGNVATGEINTVVSAIGINETVHVTNEDYSTGGYGLETLEVLKKTIPASLRTLNRAVSEQDFKDIAESHSGVSKAFVDYNCGAAVDVYIVPTGLGGASGLLVEGVKELFYDETRLILMDVNVKAAGRISAIIKANIAVLPTHNRQTTLDKVKSNLSGFLSADNQEISGSVYIGDIYQIIENTDGVQHSEVTLVSTIPQATIVNGSNDLIWVRSLFPASSTTIQWTIRYIDNDNYELRKGAVSVGNYEVGQEVILPTLKFTVQAGVYTTGDMWQFTTYKYNGTTELKEPSILTVEDSNIELIATGGV